MGCHQLIFFLGILSSFKGQAPENGTLTSNSTKGKDPKTGGGMVSNKCERKMPPGSDYGSMGGGVVTTHVHRKKPLGSDYGSKGYGVNCGRHRAPSCSRCGYKKVGELQIKILKRVLSKYCTLIIGPLKPS